MRAGCRRLPEYSRTDLSTRAWRAFLTGRSVSRAPAKGLPFFVCARKPAFWLRRRLRTMSEAALFFCLAIAVARLTLLVSPQEVEAPMDRPILPDRKSTRLNSS